MENTLATISDFAYTDRATGKLFILGVIRYIFAQSVPTTHPRVAVSFSLEEFTTNIPPDGVMAQMCVLTADGDEVVPPTPFVALPFRPIGPASVTRSMCQFTAELGNLPLPIFGDYAVILRKQSGDVIARAPFSVQPMPVRNP